MKILTDHDIAYDAWDKAMYGSCPEGCVLRFDVHEGSETRTYAALLADGRWWLTGGSAPNGVGLEDFLAWVIERNVWPVDVTALS